MQDSITKEIIALDKKLREKIELLELEKQHLDQTIDKETNKLIEQFKIDLFKLIDETNKKSETFFKVKEQSVKNDFEAQEIIDTIPSAVVLGDDGYYRVDYNQIFKGV